MKTPPIEWEDVDGILYGKHPLLSTGFIIKPTGAGNEHTLIFNNRDLIFNDSRDYLMWIANGMMILELADRAYMANSSPAIKDKCIKILNSMIQT